MNEAWELNLKLADLLGWKRRVVIENGISKQLWVNPLTGEVDVFPSWTHDDAANRRLEVDHAVDIRFIFTESVHAFCGLTVEIEEGYSEHTDKYAAVRVATVKAVIAKLENMNAFG